MYKRVKQLRHSTGFFANVLKLVSGTVLAQVITILTAPILTRLFHPESFGTASVFAALISIPGVVVCLRYEQAIMLPKEDEQAANLFALSLIISIFVSLVIGIFLFFTSRWLINLLKAPALNDYLWLVAPTLFIQGTFLAFNYWNSRRKHFGRLSVSRVAASFTTSALPITLAALGNTSTTSLIASWIAGTFVSTAVLSIQAMRASASLFFQSIRLRKITANLFRYRKFPLIDTWGIIINNLSWQLPTLMLSSYFSQSIVGYYSLANRVLMLPMTIVGNAIAQVFYQRASETYSGKGSLANLTDIVFRRLSAISLYPALLLSVLGYDLFKLVFGAEWAEAGIYVQILGPWLFFLFISSPLSTLFSIMERQELAFLIHLLILVSRIISLIMGGSTGNIYLAIALWSGTGILVYGGMAIWILRLASVAWMTVLSGAWHYFRVSFLLIVPIAIMKFIPNMPGWVLIASGGLSGLLYVVWLLREEASQIENLIKLPKINPVDGDQTLSPMD